MSEKTVVITGATSGIGYYTALEIAKLGAHVILVGRNTERGENATETIIKESGNSEIKFIVGDVSTDALDDLCLSQIARFKRPKDYVFLDQLPKNNYGKVLKTVLRESFK